MVKIKQLFIAIIAVAFSTFSVAQTTDKDFKTSNAHFKMSAHIKSGDYIDKRVIIKVKSQYRSVCSANTIEDALFKQLYTNVGGSGLTKKFPHSFSPANSVNRSGQYLADLSLIYEFNYSASVSVEKVINKFAALQLFEYVEPHYIPHVCYSPYTPNDPGLLFEYSIINIRADSAWGINTTTARGDTNVVIGITDTGTEPTHSDLKNQIKHNYADIPDGSDNDGDGYIDNFGGWDLGENDNDPTWTMSQHGVHTSGIAAASVDNAIGMAGIGFNCKFLPVKIADAIGALTFAYEGITYAADHGCAIINCSWGGAGGGQFGQDVITYATINKNALVVAAAGNNYSDELFYPASYKYVISVANTRSNDSLSVSSNYNYTVDVCAPGESIYSTYPTDSYSFQTGTSMASPCVAGAAAIVKSFYPSYTALQIGERLKMTTDNIYPIMSGPVYANKLGTGRINLYKALTQPLSPSVVMTQHNIVDNNDNNFVVADTLRIRGNYTNYLAPTTNLIATLSTTSPYINILHATTTLGAIATLAATDNNTDPFQTKILPGAPKNQAVTFKITYSDAATSYTASEFFTVIINIDYINIAINDIATTVNGNGRIGYNMDNQVGGLGFNYKNQGTILYDAGLMIGVSTSQVSDVVRGVSGGLSDADFKAVVSAHTITPATFSDFDVDGIFNDSSVSPPIPVVVHHKAFAWSSVGNRKFVIVQYVISNSGTAPLTNLYAGICADWDINAATYGSNRASFDAADKMGYAYYTGANGTYAGIRLLTNTAPVVHYAIDNLPGGGGGVDLHAGGFDSNEKYTTLSTNRTDAGVAGNGNDVLDVVSSGPFNIAVGDSIKVAFALIAGDSLADLKTSAVNAQIKYDGLYTTTVLDNAINNSDILAVYPNPTNGESMININIRENATVELKIFNLLGAEIKTIASEKMQPGMHSLLYSTSNLSNGLYYYQLIVNNKKYIHKLIVNK